MSWWPKRLFSSNRSKEPRLEIASPEKAVLVLDEILKANPKISDDDAMRLLEKRGVPSVLAVRTYLFAQLACGRLLLMDMGKLKVNYSNEYMCFNANGDVVEKGRLSEEASFTAALQHWKNAKEKGHLYFMACGATEVKTLADALTGDGPKEGFKTGTSFLMLEYLTEAGEKKFRRAVAEYLVSIGTDPKKFKFIK